MTAPGMMAAMAVPSFGATVLRKPAARALPAPGMFFGTIVGWPGMWRPRCRPTHARIDVVAAGGRRPDQEIDALAGVEIGGRCRRGRERCADGGRERGQAGTGCNRFG